MRASCETSLITHPKRLKDIRSTFALGTNTYPLHKNFLINRHRVPEIKEPSFNQLPDAAHKE